MGKGVEQFNTARRVGLPHTSERNRHLGIKSRGVVSGLIRSAIWVAVFSILATGLKSDSADCDLMQSNSPPASDCDGKNDGCDGENGQQKGINNSPTQEPPHQHQNQRREIFMSEPTELPA